MKSIVLKSMTALAVLASASLAQAESSAKVFKTLDGTVALCGANKSLNHGLAGSKNVLVELTGQSAGEKSHGTQLKVSVVKCDGEKWILDQDPTLEKYTAGNGESVEVKYSNYEVLIVDKNNVVVSTESLGEMTKSAESQISATINKSGDNPQDLEVIVRAKKSVNASGGFSETTLESFGPFRLRINQ